MAATSRLHEYACCCCYNNFHNRVNIARVINQFGWMRKQQQSPCDRENVRSPEPAGCAREEFIVKHSRVTCVECVNCEGFVNCSVTESDSIQLLRHEKPRTFDGIDAVGVESNGALEWAGEDGWLERFKNKLSSLETHQFFLKLIKQCINTQRLFNSSVYIGHGIMTWLSSIPFYVHFTFQLSGFAFFSLLRLWCGFLLGCYSLICDIGSHWMGQPRLCI